MLDAAHLATRVLLREVRAAAVTEASIFLAVLDTLLGVHILMQEPGRVFHFRYRFGIVALGIGADEATAVERCTYQDYSSARERLGGKLDGVFAGPLERNAAFARLVERIGR